MSAKASGTATKSGKKPLPPVVWLIGVAVGLGVFSWYLDWTLTNRSGLPDVLIFTAVGLLILGPVSGMVVGSATAFLGIQVRQLRVTLGERRLTRYLRVVLGLFVVLIAGSVLAAAAVRDNGVNTAVSVLLRLLVALLIGGGTVLIAFWPLLFGSDATRRSRWFGAFSWCWLAVGVFVFTLGVPAALIILGLYAVVLYRDAKRTRGLAEWKRPSLVGLCYLVGGFLLWAMMLGGSPSTGNVAKYAVEIAIIAVLGTATARITWRRSREARPIVRRIGTVATVLVPAYLVFLLLADQLAGGPFVVALFPLVGWLGFRLWRAMYADRRIGVKAAADIVFALILGSVFVVFLIWLANLLALAPAEVQWVKTAASAIHRALDLSPWIWVGIYAVLAAAHLLSALGPAKFQPIPRRLASLRVVPSVRVLRRTTTMTGIGLMVVALVGLVVPPSIGAILQRQIQAAYTVAAQEELKDEQEIAVYQAISSELPSSRPSLILLANLVEDVHRTDSSEAHKDAASPAELDMALRLGRLQGELIAEQQAPLKQPEAPAPADLGDPIHDAADLQHRLDEQQQEDKLKQARDKQAETASELSANTVTSMMDLISLGHAEALSVVHEYINGLAESPLGEIFLNWTTRALGKINPDKPPAVADVVEPDPTNLARAAKIDETLAEGPTSGLTFPDVGPLDPQGSAAIQAAVDAEHKTATVEQQHAACPSCARPGEPVIEEPEPIEHGP
ncbi:MAG TPA: hypothetical protein VG247_14470 [Pseudonocardiaceae bacterium]|jgi:hypothetical protein|nr:hypothetical protein [Pseudonocardiaceae bacterium]